MILSLAGRQMIRPSGLQMIMDDIAAVAAEADGGHWVNLGAGNPAQIADVIETWRCLMQDAIATDFAKASCQYGPARGRPELVHALVSYFCSRYGWPISEKNVVVAPGSQMIYFIATALYTGAGTSDPRYLLLPMAPDYAGYLALSMTTPGARGVPPQFLRLPGRYFRYQFDFAALASRSEAGMMLLSSPSNPAGRCVDAEELTCLTDLAQRRDIPLLLDHAYGEPFPQIASVSDSPRWHPNLVNCFTLSKAGIPGERIAFAIGPERYIEPIVSFLANSAIHAPQLAQMAVTRALETGALDTLAHSVIKPFYAARRDCAERLLSEIMPSSVDWRVHVGTGGMFCWIWVNEDWFDDMALYNSLKRKGVIVAPGRSFFAQYSRGECPDRHDRRCFRISISGGEQNLAAGIARIAAAIDELSAGRAGA